MQLQCDKALLLCLCNQNMLNYFVFRTKILYITRFFQKGYNYTDFLQFHVWTFKNKQESEAMEEFQQLVKRGGKRNPFIFVFYLH